MTGQEYIDNQELHPLWLIGRDPLKEDVTDAYEQGKGDGFNEAMSKVCKWLEEHMEEYVSADGEWSIDWNLIENMKATINKVKL